MCNILAPAPHGHILLLLRKQDGDDLKAKFQASKIVVYTPDGDIVTLDCDADLRM